MSTSFPERDRDDEKNSDNPYRTPANSYVRPGEVNSGERERYTSDERGTSYPPASQYRYGDSQQSPAPYSRNEVEIPTLNVKSVLALFFSVVFPIAGLILGIISMKEIADRQQEGKAFALTAVIVSAVYIILGVLYILFWGLIFSSFGNY